MEIESESMDAFIFYAVNGTVVQSPPRFYTRAERCLSYFVFTGAVSEEIILLLTSIKFLQADIVKVILVLCGQVPSDCGSCNQKPDDKSILENTNITADDPHTMGAIV